MPAESQGDEHHGGQVKPAKIGQVRHGQVVICLF
jgi:hypothetical protein